MKLLFKPLRFVLFICFTSIWLGFSIELRTSYMLAGKNLHYSRWDILGWIPSRGSEGSMIVSLSLSRRLAFFGLFFLFVILVLNLIAWVIVLGRYEEWRRSFTVEIAVYFTCHSITSEHMIVCFIEIDSSSINWCRFGNMFLLFVQRWVYWPDVWS